MSYRCGIGEALARQLGMEAGDPRLVCDGCGATRSVYRGKGWYEPAKWFLDGRHAPGWTGGRAGDEHRRLDFCAECSDAIALAAERARKEG
jgi:hypothetical protein